MIFENLLSTVSSQLYQDAAVAGTTSLLGISPSKVGTAQSCRELTAES
jgi:hypothetical protein